MSVRIVVLDGSTLNPGDNPWTEIEQLGHFELYPESTPEEVTPRLAGSDAIAVVNKVRINADQIAQLPNLKCVVVTATGFDCVDVTAAAAAGIPVCNVPTYGTDSVAQYTFALLLELCHHVALHSEAVHSGEWEHCPSFSFWKTPQIELVGKTLGIIGCGRIGRRVAEIANAFGMRVLGLARHQETAAPPSGLFEWATLNEIAAQSDVVSLHCALTDDSHGIISADFLSRMKSSAFLINTARGPLVDDAALADALNREVIAGAALDVVSREPIQHENPLLQAKNCLITPHMAWAMLAARQRMMQRTAENISAFLAGTPQNVVNGV
ncbi:D-2-hydroxyacid dehydrogenase [bacterium]|nr:D-2-hydroxyacid dehydrogenase [bacterium]